MSANGSGNDCGGRTFIPAMRVRDGSVRIDPEGFIGGTTPGHDPYTGPMSLTDARPWADEAACRDMPTLFDQTDRRRYAAQAAAKAVCAGCPARQQCLDEAMAEESGGYQNRYSIRGGLDPHERAALAAEMPDRGPAPIARFLGGKRPTRST